MFRRVLLFADEVQRVQCLSEFGGAGELKDIHESRGHLRNLKRELQAFFNAKTTQFHNSMVSFAVLIGQLQIKFEKALKTVQFNYATIL